MDPDLRQTGQCPVGDHRWAVALGPAPVRPSAGAGWQEDEHAVVIAEDGLTGMLLAPEPAWTNIVASNIERRRATVLTRSDDHVLWVGTIPPPGSGRP